MSPVTFFDPSIVIRTAKKADLASLLSIHLASWRSLYHSLIPSKILDNKSLEAMFQGRWENQFSEKAESDCLVLEVNQQVKGFICFSRVKNKDVSDLIQTGEIRSLYLHPSIWREGFGTLLFNKAIEMMRLQGMEEIIIWVLKENLHAILFYEHMAFEHTGLMKVDERLTVPLTEICLRKQLPQQAIENVRREKKPRYHKDKGVCKTTFLQHSSFLSERIPSPKVSLPVETSPGKEGD